MHFDSNTGTGYENVIVTFATSGPVDRAVMNDLLDHISGGIGQEVFEAMTSKPDVVAVSIPIEFSSEVVSVSAAFERFKRVLMPVLSDIPKGLPSAILPTAPVVVLGTDPDEYDQANLAMADAQGDEPSLDFAAP